MLTSHTDYVNKYLSVLQTTCYDFTATAKTMEVCVGIVKAPNVHEKSPAQHAADLEMLELQEELLSALISESGKPKLVDCVRVDGASDEGPSHEVSSVLVDISSSKARKSRNTYNYMHQW